MADYKEPPIQPRTLSESEIVSLLARLVTELPCSIPLTRRLQWELRHPSPTSQVVLNFHTQQNGFPTGDSRLDVTERIAWLIPPHSTWLAAYIDLANQGQTQCWLFGSWELPNALRNQDIERHLVHAVIKHIYTDLVPLQPTQPGEEWLTLKDTGKLLSLPYNRNKVIFGTVHDDVRQYFPEHAITRIDPSYLKYMLRSDFDPTPGKTPVVQLPHGYSFGDMKEDLLQTVLDRSNIPRTLKTLRSLTSVGLYFNGEAVGWGFLGKDGSLSSLHTEPEHRGRNLAVAVGQELAKKSESVFVDDGPPYLHADVSESNAPSNSVMKKLGGSVRWRVAWVEVNVEEAIERQGKPV